VIEVATYLRFCDEALEHLRDMVVELGDDLANRRPDLPGANSPFAILTHCLGVVANWASTVNLGEVVPRDRDAEFTATGRVAELAAETDRMRLSLAAWVAAGDPSAPPVNPPEPPEEFFVATQGGVLFHIYEELAQHRGQLEITRDLLRAAANPAPDPAPRRRAPEAHHGAARRSQLSEHQASPLVVVMGVSGSGKTTVGAALAHRLGVPFADADDLHPEANIAKMSAGIPLDDIDRRPWLEAVAQWLADHQDAGGVASCSTLRRAYRDILTRAAPTTVFLHLHGDREVLAARVAARTAHFMPAALIDSQLATLEPLEPDERGVVLDVTESVDDLVDQSVTLLRPSSQPSSQPSTEPF
jgi:gluconokinase